MKKLFVLMLAAVFAPACFAQKAGRGAEEKTAPVSSYLLRSAYAQQKSFTHLKLGSAGLEKAALASLKKKHPNAELVAGLGQIFYERTVSCDIEDVTELSWYVLVREGGVNHYYELYVVQADGREASLRMVRRLNTLKTETISHSSLQLAAYAAAEAAHVKKLQEKAAAVYQPLANNLSAVAALYPLSSVSGFEKARVVSSRKLPGDYNVNVDTVSLTVVLSDGTKKEHYFEMYPPRSINIMDTVLNARMAVAENDPAADVTHAKKTPEAANMQEKVLKEFASFADFAKRLHYYDYNFLFQGMDGVREAYMALRQASPEAAREIAPKLNAPVTLDEGRQTIRLESYINMEACTLWESEQVKFDAFGDALREDLK